MRYYSDEVVTIYNSDCRAMTDLPDETVQMCVSSPPYWGLRKYAGLSDLIWGGEGSCEHKWGIAIETGDNRFRAPSGSIVGSNDNPAVWQGGKMLSAFCSLCGAWKGQLGLEPTPDCGRPFAKLRSNLTEKELEYVLGELKRCGLF